MAHRVNRHRCRPAAFQLLGAVAVLATVAQAQEKKDAPRITAIAPISITAGAPTTLKIRGLKLDAASELRFPTFPR
jgi:hypothetical protein